MSDNVYTLVARYYKDNPGCADLLPRDVLERYLRRQAWRGAGDNELRWLWSIVELVMTYVDELQLESFGALSIFDYQEMLYRFAEKNADFALEEQPVHDWLRAVTQLFAYLAQMDLQDDYSEFMEEVEESLYVEGRFLMPPRREEENFYRDFDPEAEESKDEVDRLNQELDNILKQIGEYYQRPEFSRDNERALRIFCGPAYEPPLPPAGPEETAEGEQSAFWLSFWDYFLFDYHLLDNDSTPLSNYFEKEHARLSITAQDILRDLLNARFSVFVIESVQDDIVLCRDLFTEESMELPLPDANLAGFEHSVMFGHVRTRGVLLLNYITSVPASPKLRRRMKEVILRQYRIFQAQQPEATLDQFFAREAAAVRHILHVMSDYAQLNVVPLRDLPQLRAAAPELEESCQDEINALGEVLKRIGFSAYAVRLGTRLFLDALSACTEGGKEQADVPALLTAVLLLFIKINGYDYTATPELYQIFGSDEESTQRMRGRIEQELRTGVFDPRYLSEDGFVLSLYLLVQE